MHERTVKSVCDYAPIARAFYKMDHVTDKRIKKKFDVVYLMAKEDTKWSPCGSLKKDMVLALVNTPEWPGLCYDYIAQDLQERSSSEASIQMDDRNDFSNIEEELCLYFDPYGVDGSVHIHNQYFCVHQPNSVMQWTYLGV